MSDGDNHSTAPKGWSGQWDIHYRRGRHDGFKAGLLAAAEEICGLCGHECYGDAFRRKHADGWFHEAGETGIVYDDPCPASAIHDLIAAQANREKA